MSIAMNHLAACTCVKYVFVSLEKKTSTAAVTHYETKCRQHTNQPLKTNNTGLNSKPLVLKSSTLLRRCDCLDLKW